MQRIADEFIALRQDRLACVEAVKVIKLQQVNNPKSALSARR